MRIAQVAPPFESVPPRGYGGTERVIHTLTEELARRGHEVTLFASADSHTSARLVPTVGEAVWHHRPPYRELALFMSVVLGKVLRELDRFDIIHGHLEWWGFPLERASHTKVVSTLHGRLDLPELQIAFREYVDAPVVSISNAQRAPVHWANFVGTVYHGIDLTEFTFNKGPGRYLAFLGRASPEKGLDTAIRVARRAGMRLKVATRMPQPFRNDPYVRADWEHWEQAVLPLLGPDVDLVGEVGGHDKDEFLGNASALVFPIRWPEPFGLVMIEALACGTPVVALRAGSVPEVIRDGVTGFICESEDALVAAVGRICEIDRARCREEAERRFSGGAMADRYERVYERLTRPGPTIFDLGGGSKPTLSKP